MTNPLNARDRAAEEYLPINDGSFSSYVARDIFNAGWDACLAHMQDQNSTLKLALRRAMDALEYGDHPVAARKEVLKILADNGLEYNSDGHLVERKADPPDDGAR